MDGGGDEKGRVGPVIPSSLCLSKGLARSPPDLAYRLIELIDKVVTKTLVLLTYRLGNLVITSRRPSIVNNYQLTYLQDTLCVANLRVSVFLI